MRSADLFRYGLFAGVAATANANRRHYRLSTTWLPHLAMNSVSLLLPDLLRLLPVDALQSRRVNDRVSSAAETLTTVVRENPAYAAYVAPLAVGYLLSHPDFNIYKGAWGELQFAGFGFDALPHASAAFALAALSIDTAEQAAESFSGSGVFEEFLHWCADHPALFSGAVLALVTALWEVGEYRIHHYELAQRGDISKINMQWSLSDTVTDCAANAFGWAAAILWHARAR